MRPNTLEAGGTYAINFKALASITQEEGVAMKAFVVLDNDVCFYAVDTEFKKHMLQKCLTLKIVQVR